MAGQRQRDEHRRSVFPAIPGNESGPDRALLHGDSGQVRHIAAATSRADAAGDTGSITVLSDTGSMSVDPDTGGITQLLGVSDTGGITGLWFLGAVPALRALLHAQKPGLPGAAGALRFPSAAAGECHNLARSGLVIGDPLEDGSDACALGDDEVTNHLVRDLAQQLQVGHSWSSLGGVVSFVFRREARGVVVRGADERDALGVGSVPIGTKTGTMRGAGKVFAVERITSSVT